MPRASRVDMDREMKALRQMTRCPRVVEVDVGQEQMTHIACVKPCPVQRRQERLRGGARTTVDQNVSRPFLLFWQRVRSERLRRAEHFKIKDNRRDGHWRS